jgi:hypothetical protein
MVCFRTITTHLDKGATSTKVMFETDHYSSSCEEGTPNGKAVIYFHSPADIPHLELGAAYYFDISRADPKE